MVFDTRTTAVFPSPMGIGRLPKLSMSFLMRVSITFCDAVKFNATKAQFLHPKKFNFWQKLNF